MLGTGGGGCCSDRDDNETAGAGDERTERDECCERRLSRDATDRDAIDGVMSGGGENGSAGRAGPLIISGVPRSSNVRSSIGLSRPRGGFRILGRLGLRSWRRRHGSDRLYARARRGTQGNHWLKSALIQNSRIELTRRRKTVSE